MFLEDFFGFVSSMSFDRFVRIFWFFFFFEFVRYFFIDTVMIILWWVSSHINKGKYKEAKRMLYLENPLVSIIVPGKNEGKHIYKLAKSLKEQTYQNYELIIVDDGSDDQTPIIGRSLERSGLINRFIRNEVRGGKASGANTALRFVKGKYIVHLDADCSYDRDAIEQILIHFYLDPKCGAVGGNVVVRNWTESLATTLQTLEYYDTISIGRIVSSKLGIYRIISGAFGAFRADVIHRLGGWDIGPGLDGDITVKFRKLGYKIRFAPLSMCQTSVPVKLKKLAKQRLRWDKSLIRFRLRKHANVFFPGKSFSMSNFISFLENIVYNLVLNFKWYIYIFDLFYNFSSHIGYIILLNLLLYTGNNYFKFLFFSLFRDRKNAPLTYFLPYIPLMVIYFGYFLRIVRTIAYIKEFFFKASYKDPWNPVKTSQHAKVLRL